jgi:hypothetical protein
VGLVRVYTALNNLIIRNIGDTGGPSSSRVDEELNRIIAWAKDAPRNILRDTSTVGNVGTGVDNLHNISIPAATLATNGDYLTGEGGGKFAANTNVKTVTFNVDGVAQAIIAVADGPQGWVLRYKIIRLSATSVRVNCTLEANVVRINSAGAVTLSTGFSFQANNADEPVADLAANALAILVTGQSVDGGGGVNNNDVTQTLSIVELCQQ